MKTQQYSKYTKIHYTFDLNPVLDCEEPIIQMETKSPKPEWNNVFNQWCEERGPEAWDWLQEMKKVK